MCSSSLVTVLRVLLLLFTGARCLVTMNRKWAALSQWGVNIMYKSTFPLRYSTGTIQTSSSVCFLLVDADLVCQESVLHYLLLVQSSAHNLHELLLTLSIMGKKFKHLNFELGDIFSWLIGSNTTNSQNRGLGSKQRVSESTSALIIDFNTAFNDVQLH